GGVVSGGGWRVGEGWGTGMGGRLKHVGVDEHGEHAQGFVVFDETHAAHVGGQIIDVRRATSRCFAVFLHIEIEGNIFHVIEALIPLIERLYINATDALKTAAAQRRNKRAADEAACATYHHQ